MGVDNVFLWADLLRLSQVNRDDLYAVLRKVAKARSHLTYSDLSLQYYERTHDAFEPHGTWDGPLGGLNMHLDETGAPPLSVLVVLKGTGEPGGGFWGSAPSVPERPKDEAQRLAKWMELLKSVHNYDWPTSLP